MKKIFSFLKSFILVLILSNCGFKVVDQSKLINFKVGSISISGDSRISYIIKNKLLPYSKNNEKKIINLDIEVKKTKDIKEKNIKNEITKFQISITMNVQYGDNFSEKFEISNKGDFLVTNQYSQTLNNEKKLIKTLSESLAEELIEKLMERVGDT